MRHLLSILVLSAAMHLTPACRASIATADPGASADLSETFTVSSNTQIPGKVLKPGSYRIRVLDHLSDRVILRVEDASGKSEGIFLGVPNPSVAAGTSSGPISWQTGPHKTETLRGFAFPGGAVEFVYNKEEAVPIAKSNAAKVLAIDPASEGRPKGNKLSDEDRQMVTLWTLAATRVGPNDSQKAIEAQRYNPPPAPVKVARQTPPASIAPEPAAAAPTPIARTAPRSVPLQQMASAKRPAGITALPHTGSDLPLAALSGLLLLLAAVVMRTLRAVRS